ncbi:hypothetical protein RJ641_035045, partial [Dillenia turbinata]
VLMIIKGLFRRYERWNPVHPTSGAFWGMGLGIGCGVGWGPGFGPEVIGYVGAGCGIGFSVGITLLGIGIGLPANFLIKVPYDALVATRSSAREIVQSGSLQFVKTVPGNGWKNVIPCISGWQSETFGPFLGFKHEDFMKNAVNLSDIKSAMASNAKSIWENLRMCSSNIFNPREGILEYDSIYPISALDSYPDSDLAQAFYDQLPHMNIINSIDTGKGDEGHSDAEVTKISFALVPQGHCASLGLNWLLKKELTFSATRDAPWQAREGRNADTDSKDLQHVQ